MVFLETLQRYGYTPADCAVVTVGTDGLDINFNRLICVSVLPIMGAAKPSTVYIEGADIYTSAPYTGVNEITYRTEALTESLASLRIQDVLQPYKVLIGHNARDFTFYFITRLDRRYENKEWLDTLGLAHYYYEKQPSAVKNVPTLETFMDAVTSKRYNKKRDWRLSSLCPFDPGDYYNIPEKNAIRTKALFIYLLGREAPTPSIL